MSAEQNVDEISMNQITANGTIQQPSVTEQKDVVVLKSYARRWFVLAGYCLLSTSNLSTWFAFSAISNIIQKYYEINLIDVNWLATIYAVVSVVLMFPSNQVLEKKGLGIVMVFASFVNALGCCIRYIGYSSTSSGYWFLVTGSVFCAFSTSAFIFLPSKIAALWFGEKERATATSIAVSADSLGLALGYFLPTAMVKLQPTIQKIGEGLGKYLLLAALQSCASFIFIVVAAKDKPRTPPSSSELQKEKSEESHAEVVQSIELNEIMEGNDAHKSSHILVLPSTRQSVTHRTLAGYKALLKNINFHKILHLHGILFALESVFLTALNEILIPRFPGHEFEVGLMGALGLVFSMATNFFVGKLLDRIRAFKMVTIITTGLVTLLSGLLTLFFYLRLSFYTLFSTYLFVVTIFATYYTTAFDHCAELTYPVSESRSGVILLWVAQVYSIIFPLVASFILFHSSAQILMIFILCLYCLTFLISLVLKDKGPRGTSLFEESNSINGETS